MQTARHPRQLILAVAALVASSAYYPANAASRSLLCPARPPIAISVYLNGAKPGDSLLEEFSFVIERLKLSHQSEEHTLRIAVRYAYVPRIADSAYPDFRLVAKDIEGFLTTYPNETDYWEVLNKRLARSILLKYPTVAAITIEIQVPPSELDPYPRSSIVTSRRSDPPSKKAPRNRRRQ